MASTHRIFSIHLSGYMPTEGEQVVHIYHSALLQSCLPLSLISLKMGMIRFKSQTSEEAISEHVLGAAIHCDIQGH